MFDPEDLRQQSKLDAKSEGVAANGLFVVHELRPWIRAAAKGSFGGLIGFLASAVLCGNILGILPIPWQVMLPSVATGFLIGAVLPGRRRWLALRVDPAGVVVASNVGEPRFISYEEIRLVEGEGGVDLSGGEIWPWKRIRIMTGIETLTLAFDPAQNAACFEQLISRCPSAVGVSFTGEVRLPAVITQSQ